MGVKKQLQGHGDPLLMEVVAGLEEMITSNHNEKQSGGVRGVGERTFSQGDALLKETERYHHQAHHDHHEVLRLADYLRRNKRNSLTDPNSVDALFDPILGEYVVPKRLLEELNALEKADGEVAQREELLKRQKNNSLFSSHYGAMYDPVLEEYILPGTTMLELKALEEDVIKKRHLFDEMQVAPREELLKRQKNNSLFSSHYGAMYDPVLQEYVLPSTTMLELKALKEDAIKKRHLFDEMQIRRVHNLQNCELFCDPLCHTYRTRELILKGTPPPLAAPKDKMARNLATPSKYRKLNQGDDLLTAFMEYQVTSE